MDPDFICCFQLAQAVSRPCNNLTDQRYGIFVDRNTLYAWLALVHQEKREEDTRGLWQTRLGDT